MELLLVMREDRKADREEMNASHKKMMARMDASHEEAENMRNDMKTNQAELQSAIAQIEWKEPASVEMKPEVAHEEVPVEDAVRMPVGEPRKRRRDRNLDARRRRKQQERTQNKDGCRKNLVATCRGTTRGATVAWRKINVFRKILTHGNCGLRKEVTAAGMRITRCSGYRRKRQNKDDAERETRKGRTEENRRRKGPQCKTGIMDPTMNNIEGWNPGERAPLGSGRTRKKDIRDILERRSWNMESEPPVAYEEGGNGHCGGVGPLRNGRRNSISVRIAG
jgi:hypothetical protein